MKTLLIPHKENLTPTESGIELEPDKIDHISYPYEWSFSQLKDAALCTLAIQKEALNLQYSLKDASAYNIQFKDGSPLLIDTLSFIPYEEGRPWIAYQQFCQHFLAPLALSAYSDARLQQLLRLWIDGIPLDIASKILPFKSKLNFGLLVHLHAHSKSQKQNRVSEDSKHRHLSKIGLLGLIDSLDSTIRSLKYSPVGTTWANYYNETNYADAAMQRKEELVRHFLKDSGASLVWDLGANNGRFSHIASDLGASVVAWDIDAAAVEQLYLSSKRLGQGKILPLVQDFSNPSPGLGWQCTERDSFFQRPSPDCVLALALIHHIAIGNNVPLPNIAVFFRRISPQLIIEFVPKSDSQVQRMLRHREDIFDHYESSYFESAFLEYFSISSKTQIPGTQRTLYHFKAVVE